jgi:phenylacetate-CoA ligase
MTSFHSLTWKALKLLPFYRTYIDTYNFLKISQWWNREQIEKYQMDQISKLLSHAYNNVPYYKNLFDEIHLAPGDVRNFQDFKKIPFITKEIIRENLYDLKAINYPEDSFEYVTTGGSTGVPLGLYYQRGVSRAIEWAFMKSLWDRVGYRFRDKCVVLRGNAVKSEIRDKSWDYSLFGRWLILSSFNMDADNLPNYVEVIRKFEPKFIQAYPSAITILAKFMKENDIKPFPTVKAILCGSENMYEWQRELLEKTFQCRIYSWYGHTEMAVLAGECEFSSYYHLFPEYGYTEIVGEDGDVLRNGPKVGEIVATSFNNFSFPLIRYRTMDLAVPTDVFCSCGRKCRLLERVEGRMQDLIVTKDNRLITLTALIFSQHFEAFSKIRQMQLHQKEKGELIVKIVRNKDYSDIDVEEILTKMKNVCGCNGLNICFDYVDFIPRTRQGKYRFLIQELQIEIAMPL